MQKEADKDLKFGIIGYGKMGEIRHRALEKINNCRVVAIFEPNKRTDLPKGIKSCGKVEEIYNLDEIDAVIICVPNYLIKPYVIASLEKGKHVFCEKPPGMDVKDIKNVILVEKKIKKFNY
mgnify:CR=1 FL=1